MHEEKRFNERKENIRCHRSIIIDEGAAAISTTKVAKKVGISQSNIYLYFKDKRALLDGVYLREIGRLEETTGMKQMLDPNEAMIPVFFHT